MGANDNAVKAAATLTTATTGVPCPTERDLGNTDSTKQPVGAARRAKVTVSTDVAFTTLVKAVSWRLPLVVIPYIAYVYSVLKTAEVTPDYFASTVSLWTPIVGTSLYLCAVFGGKKFMASRDKMQPTEWMIVYNLYQTCMNIYCVYAFIAEVAALYPGKIWGLGVDRSPAGGRLGFVIWLHYNNKYIEFFDTFFMVVRKSNKQISFLHVYHHFLLVWAWYFVCKVACGGDAYFGAIMNSFIHVVMYGYYLMSLLKLNCPWKKQVTKLQMVQFVVCMTHASYMLYNGDKYYPPALSALNIFVMVNMLVLFGNFYRQAYNDAKNAKEDAAKKAAEGTEGVKDKKKVA